MNMRCQGCSDYGPHVCPQCVVRTATAWSTLFGDPRLKTMLDKADRSRERHLVDAFKQAEAAG